MDFKGRNVRCTVSDTRPVCHRLGGSVPSHSRREFYHEGVDAGYKFVSDFLQSLWALSSLSSKVRTTESAAYLRLWKWLLRLLAWEVNS